MSANGIVFYHVEDQSLYKTVSDLAIAHLTNNGSSDISILSVDHMVSESSSKANVYAVEFSDDGGTAMLSVTLFSNGTHSVEED